MTSVKCICVHIYDNNINVCPNLGILQVYPYPIIYISCTQRFLYYKRQFLLFINILFQLMNVCCTFVNNLELYMTSCLGSM